MLLLIACLPASLLLRLALCVSVVVPFLWLSGGVISARLVMSNRDNDVTAWFGVEMSSSCDVES